MRKYILILLIFNANLLMAQFDPTNMKSWTPAFSDEFEYPDWSHFYDANINSSSSTYRANPWILSVWGWDHDPLNHNENVYWASDNTYSTIAFHPDSDPNNNYMTLYLIKQDKSVTYTSGGSSTTVLYNYITSVLSTSRSLGWKYGYIEMSYRLPDWKATKWTSNYLGQLYPIKTNLAGFSTAFWMYESNSTVTWSEIDLFENSTGFNDNSPNVHYQDNTMSSPYHTWQDASIYRDVPYMIYNNTWHTIGLEWTPDYIKIYNDDKTNMSSVKHSDQLLQMGLILNESINAYWNTLTGHPNYNEVGDSRTNFPYYIDINYIKVWKPNLPVGGCSALANVAISLPPGNSFVYELKKSVTIGAFSGATSNVIVHNTQKYSFIASKFVQLNRNFTVNKGGVFSAAIMPCY